MDFFEAQDFFKNMYPGKKINYEFDDNCHRKVEIIHTDSKPNMIHHVECNKVKMTVEGMPAIYVPIMSHRFNVSWKFAKTLIASKTDVFLHENDLETLLDMRDKDQNTYHGLLSEYSENSGLPQDKILEKMAQQAAKRSG